jgi:hypothetical protein
MQTNVVIVSLKCYDLFVPNPMKLMKLHNLGSLHHHRYRLTETYILVYPYTDTYRSGIRAERVGELSRVDTLGEGVGSVFSGSQETLFALKGGGGKKLVLSV